MATLPHNVTGLVSYSQYLNDVTSQLFWPLALVTFCVIMFVSLVYSFGGKRAMASTMFSGTVMALLMRVMGLVDDNLLYVFVVGVGFSIFWLVADQS